MVNSTVERIFLIVFPPYGEESFSETDIRLGLVLKDNLDSLLMISTDMSDIWSPLLNEESIPYKHYNESDFENRIKEWVEQRLEDEIVLEYYEVTNSINFKDIIGKKIKAIDLIMLEGNLEPFGIRFLFDNEFILSFPNSDGNTIETKNFNNNNGLAKYNHLGKVTFTSV